jgi:SAM-dependent methyltransferase
MAPEGDAAMADADFELSDVFEDLVDWEKRLAGEEPFYRKVFEEVGAKSVLDAACGTGRHASLFHSWGLKVSGADVSPRMIEKARAAFGDPEGLSWSVRGFEESAGQEDPFDVVLCVGNSLSLAPDTKTVEAAVYAMAGAVRKGGAVIVHLQNRWRFEDGPCLWQKCRRTSTPDGDAYVVKGVHRCGRRAYVELLLIPVDDPEGMKSTRLDLTPIEVVDLEKMFRDCGAAGVELYGSYKETPYEREKSVDLIVKAIM